VKGVTSSIQTQLNGKQNALTNPVTGTGTTNYLPKFTGSTTIGNSNLINDASGNIGLGVTPSAWGSPFVVSQYPYGSYFGGTTTGGTVMGNNNYYNGSSYIYQNSDYATQYQQGSGSHLWRIASSGTAGAAISFTQAMTLTSGGNLILTTGAVSDNGARLQVSGVGYFGSTNYSNLIVDGTNTSGWGNNIAFRNQGTDFGYLGSIGSLLGNTTKDMTIWATSGNGFRVYTNGNNKQLEITTTGAATFSSSVTATNYFASSAESFRTYNDNGYISFFNSSNTTRQGYIQVQSTAMTLAAEGGSAFMAFTTAGSERLRINSAGDIQYKGSSTTTNAQAYIENTNADLIFYASLSGSVSKNMRFFYNGGTGEGMRITSGGNVGIGTTNPLDNLVVSNAGANGLHFDATFSGGASTIYSYNRSTNAYTNLRLQGLGLTFLAGANPAMTITSGGNVLIGTTTDAGYKLDVNGSGRFGAIMLADRISLSSYASLYGKKVVKADNVSSFTFNLSTIFPEMSSAFATNVVGCFGMYTIFRGGQGETGIFSISRNGSSWSSPSYSIQTATGAYSLSTVTGSGTSITLVFNTNVYVMVEVTAMIE
jgi:hypothetical protein